MVENLPKFHWVMSDRNKEAFYFWHISDNLIEVDKAQGQNQNTAHYYSCDQDITLRIFFFFVNILIESFPLSKGKFIVKSKELINELWQQAKSRMQLSIFY